MKAETQTYYQALIDNRDSPFIVSEYMAVGTGSLVFLKEYKYCCFLALL